jgi:hypothetical protein
MFGAIKLERKGLKALSECDKKLPHSSLLISHSFQVKSKTPLQPLSKK